MGTPFTTEQHETVKTFWFEKNMTARQIADEIGGKTRSAILGYIHRQWGGGSKPKASPRPRRDPYQTRTTTPKIKAKAMPVIAPHEYDTTTAKRVPLMEVGDRDCHFIVAGEGAGALYCAVWAGDDSPYCSHHHARCYTSNENYNLKRIEGSKGVWR